MTKTGPNGVDDLPNVLAGAFRIPDRALLETLKASTHRPRILLLYGSLRDRSFSRFHGRNDDELLKAFGLSSGLEELA